MCALSSTQLLSQLSLQEPMPSCYTLLTQRVLHETIKNVQLYNQTYSLAIGVLKVLKRVVTILTDKIVDLETFDGLLSDRACQIRAILVASHYLMLKKGLNKAYTLEKIDLLTRALLQKQEELKEKSPVLMQEKTTREQLLDKVGKLAIPIELLQLTQLFLLNEIKEFKPKASECHDCKQQVVGFREETEQQKLSFYFDPAHLSLKAFVDATKVLLCEQSIRHLQKMCRTAADPVTQLMLSDKNIRMINKKMELPCFYTVKGALDSALEMKMGVLLKVKRADHTVEPDPKLPFEVQIPLTPLGSDLSAPILVFEAIKGGQDLTQESAQTYLERLQKHDLHHLIVLNIAKHPQYSDNGGLDTVPLLAQEKKEKERLEALAQKALEVGCCLENMRLLRITHIFCDTLGSQKQKEEKGHARKEP